MKIKPNTRKWKKKLNLFGEMKGLKKWYKNLSIIDKRILFGFLGLIILILFFNMTLEAVRTYDSDLSVQECNQLRIDDVRDYLELQEDNNLLAFLYAFSFPFKVLVIAVAISWVLHGVGFKIIGRLN